MNQVSALPSADRASLSAQPPRGPAATRAEVHARIAPFIRASSFEGYKSFAIDLALYLGGLAAVMFAPWLAAKVVGGLLAGQALVNFGSLSHEAAHRAVVRSRLGNKIIAVVTFTAIFFNYRLWVHEHHVLHHGRTNTKENNFLSPPTLEEYRAMPSWRRRLHRVYHSPSGLGILLYYLLERWPSVHFWPGAWLPRKLRPSAFFYTALVITYAAALVSALVGVALSRGESVAVALLCGLVLPYTIWFMTFSMTAFLQHTNPQLRWYRDMANMPAPPESTAIHVGIPHWMNHITHYVLEHSVHHVSAMIPHYHLKAAQTALADLVEPHILTMPFTLANMQDVLRRCRIYDFETHVWRDFDGQVTAIPLEIRRAELASSEGNALPPYGAADTSGSVFFPECEAPDVAATASREKAD